MFGRLNELFLSTMLVLILSTGALLTPSAAYAQCANPVVTSCSVYQSCFAKNCNCAGSPDEYFISYGKKYCDRFLDSTDLSPEGKKWRNSTLICLQESIVPHLNIGNPNSCNCKGMKKIAFDSHVSCYTQASNSICDLGIGDYFEILRIIDTTDILSGDGKATFRGIAAVCKTTAKDSVMRDLWDTLASTLSTNNLETSAGAAKSLIKYLEKKYPEAITK